MISDKNYSINCIKCLAEMAFTCPMLRKYMTDHYEIFKEMLLYLRQHQGGGIGIQIFSNIIAKAI